MQIYKFWRLMFAVFGLLLAACVVIMVKEDRKRKEIAFMLDAYGKEAKVVGFQLVRVQVGKNYENRDYAILENATGERLQAELRSKPALVGEVWSIQQDNLRIVLGERIRGVERETQQNPMEQSGGLPTRAGLYLFCYNTSVHSHHSQEETLCIFQAVKNARCHAA